MRIAIGGLMRENIVVLLLLAASLPVMAQGTYTQIDYPGVGVSYTEVYGINLAGDVVGRYDNISGQHGYLLQAGTYTDLQGPEKSGSTIPYGINDVGQVTGFSADGKGFLYDIGTKKFTAFRYSESTFTFAHAINNSSIVVGEVRGAYSNSSVGFEFDGTTFTTLKAPGAKYTVLTSINDLGEALGFGEYDFGLSFFLFSEGGLTRLGYTANVYPSGINDAEAMAGFYRVGAQNLFAGFVLQNGNRQSLRFPGARSTYVYSINDAGDVGGSFVSIDGSVHGFIWRPSADLVK
jgi:uncharacterized membrane protein